MMLKLAVKSGSELEHAPRAMPGGRAALLELYSARSTFAAAHSAASPAFDAAEPERIPAREERFRL